MGERNYRKCPECGWFWTDASYEYDREICPLCADRAEVVQ